VKLELVIVVASMAREKVAVTVELVATPVAPGAGVRAVTVGALFWIVQAWEAGVASTFPAPSVARTWNVCVPRARAEYVFGLVHAANAAASSLHSNVEPLSLEVKSNEAVVAVVGSAGADEIVVFGAVTSTVHVYAAGVASMLPAKSVARTSKVCEPSASAV
jgi:hypothetical protein